MVPDEEQELGVNLDEPVMYRHPDGTEQIGRITHREEWLPAIAVFKAPDDTMMVLDITGSDSYNIRNATEKEIFAAMLKGTIL